MPKQPQACQQANTDPRASDKLRLKYLAWVGKNPTAPALRKIGWHRSTCPNWMGDGNIPHYWRSAMEAQMAEGPYKP